MSSKIVPKWWEKTLSELKVGEIVYDFSAPNQTKKVLAVNHCTCGDTTCPKINIEYDYTSHPAWENGNRNAYVRVDTYVF